MTDNIDLMEVVRTTATMVTINITTWGASITDKNATAEVINAHGALKNAGAFRKALFPGADAFLKDIRAVQNSFRSRAREMTLPMHSAKSEAPYRLLPNARARDFIKMYADHKTALDAALDRAERAYDEAKRAAQHNLGTLYNEEDYRDPSELRDAYTIDIDMQPFPTKDAFRQSIALPDSVSEVLNRRMEVRMQERINTMTAEVARRAIEHADYIQQRMEELCMAEIATRRGETPKKTRFTDQPMQRAAEIRDFTREIATMLNDEHLSFIADRMDELARVDPLDLKGDPYAMREMAVIASRVTEKPVFELDDVPPPLNKKNTKPDNEPEALPVDTEDDVAAMLMDEFQIEPDLQPEEPEVAEIPEPTPEPKKPAKKATKAKAKPKAQPKPDDDNVALGEFFAD